MSAEAETPRLLDTWVHRANSAVVVLIVGRSEERVEVLSDSSFIDGRASFSLALFLRNFELELRP